MSKNQEIDPFQGRPHNLASNLIAGAAGLATAGLGVVAFRNGISLEDELTLSPPVYPEITDGIVQANQLMREVGVPFAVGSLIGLAGYRARAMFDKVAAARYKLASTELSGVEVLHGSRIRRRLGGLMLTGAAGLFITTGTSIEQEVADGPIRTVRAAGDLLSGSPDGPVYVAEHDEVHFMDDSFVTSDQIEKLKAAAAAHPEVSVKVFDIGLPTLFLPDGDTTDGIILAVPDIWDSNYSQLAPGSTRQIPVVIDESLGIGIEANLDTNRNTGQQLIVMDESTGASSMNRSAVVMDIKDFNEQIEGEQVGEEKFFGAAISGASKEMVEEIVESAGLSDETGILSENDLIENNEKFWRNNGTAIMVQQILYVASLSGIAIGAAKLQKLQQSVKEIGTILSMGMDKNTLRTIEGLRVLRDTTMASAMSLGLVPIFAGILNSTVRGLEVGTSIKSAGTAYSLMVMSAALSSARALGRFTRQNSIARMMKG